MNELSRVWDSPGELPGNYEAAKIALAECAEIDQCKEWADKAHALASYARQADDPTIFNYATRIQARAVRRAGALLKAYDGRPQNAAKQSGDAPTLISQRQAAEAAGLSKDQQVQAVRVANIPQPEFELQVESANPPTVTALAEQGTKPAAQFDGLERLEGFAEAGRFMGLLKDLAGFVAEIEPGHVRGGMYAPEALNAFSKAQAVADWLAEFLALKED